MFTTFQNIVSKTSVLFIMLTCSLGLAAELQNNGPSKSAAPSTEISTDQYIAQLLRLQIVPNDADVNNQILYDKEKNPKGHFIKENEFYQIATSILGAAILGPTYTTEQQIKIIEHARGQRFDLAKVAELNKHDNDTISAGSGGDQTELFSPSSSPTCAAFFTTYLERFDNTTTTNGASPSGFKLIKALANGSSLSSLSCNGKTADDLIEEMSSIAKKELARVNNEIKSCVEIKECEDLQEEKQGILEEMQQDSAFFSDFKEHNKDVATQAVPLHKPIWVEQAARTSAEIIPLSGVDVVFTNGTANCASADVVNNLATEIDRFNKLRQSGSKLNPYLGINSDKNCEVVYQFHPTQAPITEQTRFKNEQAILKAMTPGRSSR